MAGLGKKTFVAGEVLLAQDVNGYLMDQSVMVFGGTAARSSAIPTPTEGMMSYRTDDNVVEVFDGSAYVGVGGSDSGLIHINTTTFTSVSSISLDDVFSADYKNYKIIIIANNSTASSAAHLMRLRASATDNSANNYRWSGVFTFDNSATPTPTGTGSNGATSSFSLGATSSVAGFTGHTITEISNPFESIHTTETTMSVFYDQTAPRGATSLRSGSMTVNTSYTGFTILSSSGDITGSISVWGYKS